MLTDARVMSERDWFAYGMRTERMRGFVLHGNAGTPIISERRGRLLVDAGCDCTLLRHLRGYAKMAGDGEDAEGLPPGFHWDRDWEHPHFMGCWALELLLGKG